MLHHNLLLIYRNFIRAKSFFLINVVGLTAGLTCTLLIYLWVADEIRMDKFNEKDSRLFQVMEHQVYADDIFTVTSTPGLLAETLKEEIPEVELAATTTWINSNTLSVKDINLKADGYHVGKDYFSIFSFPLTEGNPETVLDDKSSVVISTELATKLFGDNENVIGKIIEVQHNKTFQVSGVFKKIPSSSYQFDFVLSYDAFKDDNEWLLNWRSNGPSTFVVLKEGIDANEVSNKIKDFIKTKNKDSKITLFLQQYSERYLHGRFENGQPAGGRIEYVRLFSILAIFILLIACINFMNLSTARASRKAKEVGIKKSVGAQRSSLIIQYISESMITSALSVSVALLTVWLFLPSFNMITAKHIVFKLNDPVLFVGIVAVTLLTGLIAGSYPALFLSGMKPVKVLKGQQHGSWGELWARKGLVIFQFFLSVILIASVLVFYKQIEFTQSKNLGYNKDNLIKFPIEGKVKSTVQTFLTELKKIPGVVNASSVGHNLVGRNNNTSGLEWQGKDPEVEILFEQVQVNYDLMEMMEFKMAAGRTFSREFSTDTAKIIFNEAAISIMNLDEPVGKTIKLGDRNMEIIGVVSDFHFQSFHNAIEPLFIFLSEEGTWNIMVRLESGKEKETLKHITEFYSTYNPGFTLDYTFLDEAYARQYSAEQRVATLSTYFAVFAILISSLGLFGLAAFTAERRLKEMGIRKALGSSSMNILILLSGDFTKMVVIAIAMGIPASYWILNKWLQRFVFHIELEAWYFIAAGIIALIIVWATVASQALKAANVNPVECLRMD
jgi:putative ABC transport system permease protein